MSQIDLGFSFKHKMSCPARITITTFNIWGPNYWPERSSALSQTLQSIRSDVYMFQEVTPEIIAFLDGTLGGYARVHDDGREGWKKESNIYWNCNLFDMVDHGFGDLEMRNYPDRGLFWVRLKLKGSELTVFVSTAHFPWVGSDYEIQTGMNQRIPAAAKVCEHLRRLVPPQEPAIFGGDLNEDFHPVRILSEEIGLLDVFESLDLPPPITHPVRPCDPCEDMKPSSTLDWLLCTLPSNCRVVGAFVKSIRGGKYPPVSDHMPVVGIFEIAE